MGQHELIVYLEKSKDWVVKEDILKDLDMHYNQFKQILTRTRKSNNGYIIESKKKQLKNKSRGNTKQTFYRIIKGDTTKKKTKVFECRPMFKYLQGEAYTGVAKYNNIDLDTREKINKLKVNLNGKKNM